MNARLTMVDAIKYARIQSAPISANVKPASSLEPTNGVVQVGWDFLEIIQYCTFFGKYISRCFIE